MCASPSRVPVRLGWFHLLAGSLSVLFAGSLVGYAVTDPPVLAVDPSFALYAIPGDVVVVNPPVVDTDPAFYQHVGWYVTRGGVPYVDVWDVNPPLTFAVAAVLAVVAGGNLLLQHALGVLLTFAAVGAAVVLTGWLAYDLTGDDAAAVAAALVLLVPAEVYGLPPYGLRSQFFALLFGVLALVLVRRARPFAAGACAAAAGGFWQPGGAVALLVVGMAAQESGRTGAMRAIAGGLAVAGLVVLPFLAVGAFAPMVAQTVLAPLYGQEPYTLLARTYRLALAMGYGTVLLPVAVAGWGLSAIPGAGWSPFALDLWERWWVPAGGLLYGLQVYLVNFDGSLDALLFLVFVALGVAVVVAALPADGGRWAVAAVGLLVVTGPVWHLAPSVPPRGTVETQYEQADKDANPALEGAGSAVPEMQTIYWEKREPNSCHYRLSHTELRWTAQTDARLDDRRCGTWPGPPG